jgi:glycosyltransferase involved in cell wall biosynthesis
LNVDVSVVICTNDEARWPQLQAALDSVDRQPLPAVETVVVVDHNERLLESARREWPGRVVVENSGRRGLGGARNTGIRASSGSIVAFLDDDAIASPAWLSRLTEPYSDPDVAGVGGSAEPLWEGGRPHWFPVEFDWVVGCTYRGMPEVVREVRNLMGCNMSYRRDVLDALGGFRLGYGCDETELCIRVCQRWPRKTLVFVPEGKVLHRVPAARARLAYLISRCFFEGVSKAVVSKLVGVGAGLSSERRYTREVLPRGVRQGIGDFVQQGDFEGLARAAVIVAGLTTTSAGYVSGWLSSSRAARSRGFGDEPLPTALEARRAHAGGAVR